MSEAADTAWNLIRRNGDVTPDVKTMDQARAWVILQWPDWEEWIGHQMLDNIAEIVLSKALRRPNA